MERKLLSQTKGKSTWGLAGGKRQRDAQRMKEGERKRKMSVICTNCGTENKDGAKFCVSCGSGLSGRGAAQGGAFRGGAAPAGYQNTASANPGAVYAVPDQDRDQVMGLGAWLLVFLLMIIPIVNIICLIVWAVSGKTNRNKQNMARAAIIWMVIGIVLAMLLGAVVTPFIMDAVSNAVAVNAGLSTEELQQLTEAMEQLQNMDLSQEQLEEMGLTPEQIEELEEGM